VAERYAKGEGELLTGLDLANFAAWWDAEKPRAAWAERHGGQFERVKQFLSDSRAAADARGAAERERAEHERTRLLRQRGILAAVLLMTLLFAGVSYSQWRSNQAQRQVAEAQTRMAEAQKQEAQAQKQQAEAQKQEAEAQKQEAEAQKREAEGQKQNAIAQRVTADEMRKEAQDQEERVKRTLGALQEEKAKTDSALAEARRARREADFLLGLPGMLTAARTYLTRVKPDEVKPIVADLRRTSFTPSVALSTDELGVSIRGYDVVAYFRDGKARFVGDAANYAIWGGGIWLFASDKNRSEFLADPARYVPEYGGFCAYCMALGHKVHGDPQYWEVHGGRLYLHETQVVREEWLKTPERYIADANKQWPALSRRPVNTTSNIGLSEQLKEALAER
jgi:hypothetical protein